MVFDKWIKSWKTAIAENFFLRITTLLLAVGLITSTSFFKKSERIVIVPSVITESVWIDRYKASRPYLEQMAVFFATFAGNLSPLNVEYNVKEIIKHVHHKRQVDVKTDLTAQAIYIKKNNIRQSFYPESVIIDEENNTATVEGVVYRGIGTTKLSSEKLVYKMRFIIDNYKLYLDDFYVDYPERQKTALKRSGVLTDIETIKEGERRGGINE